MHIAKVIFCFVCIPCVLGGAKLRAEDREHWAFVPPRRPEVPRVDKSSWCKNAIDAFVLARLLKNGLQPADEADRSTLLRRITYDLTGLPHTPDELSELLGASRVGLGGCPPRPPTDPDSRVKTHPARHVADSLSLTRSVRCTVTRSEVRCPRRGSGLRSTTRHPLRSTGSGRARSPASSLL